jgi:hypothetical protein
MSVCLDCFGKGRKKFTLARFNPSCVTSHLMRIHKNEKIPRERVVSENAPAAYAAMKVYHER